MLSFILKIIDKVILGNIKFIIFLMFNAVLALLVLNLMIFKNFKNYQKKINSLEKIIKEKTNEVSVGSENEYKFAALEEKLKQIYMKFDNFLQHNIKNNKSINRAMYVTNDLLGIIQNQNSGFEHSMNSLIKRFGQISSTGALGEFSLKKILVQMGLKAKEDFQIQRILSNGSRPDVTVFLEKGDKDGLVLYVDAKASLNSSRGGTLEIQKSLLNRYKSQIKILAGKNYHTYGNSLPFSILYIPSDYLFIQLIESDPNIIEFAFTKSVILAGPTTLPIIILLFKDIICKQKVNLPSNP